LRGSTHIFAYNYRRSSSAQLEPSTAQCLIRFTQAHSHSSASSGTPSTSTSMSTTTKFFRWPSTKMASNATLTLRSWLRLAILIILSSASGLRPILKRTTMARSTMHWVAAITRNSSIFLVAAKSARLQLTNLVPQVLEQPPVQVVLQQPARIQDQDKALLQVEPPEVVLQV